MATAVAGSSDLFETNVTFKNSSGDKISLKAVFQVGISYLFSASAPIKSRQLEALVIPDRGAPIPPAAEILRVQAQ